MANEHTDKTKAVDVYIDCIPPKSTAQASSRILKRKDGTQFIGRMEGSKGAQVKRGLVSLLHQHRPSEPLTGPLGVVVRWVYPWRKSETKTNRARGWMHCDKRPDADNIEKMLMDAMGLCGYWLDDAQVADMRLIKAWGDRPGIGIEIVRLGVDAEAHNAEVSR